MGFFSDALGLTSPTRQESAQTPEAPTGVPAPTGENPMASPPVIAESAPAAAPVSAAEVQVTQPPVPEMTAPVTSPPIESQPSPEVSTSPVETPTAAPIPPLAETPSPFSEVSTSVVTATPAEGSTGTQTLASQLAGETPTAAPAPSPASETSSVESAVTAEEPAQPSAVPEMSQTITPVETISPSAEPVPATSALPTETNPAATVFLNPDGSIKQDHTEVPGPGQSMNIDTSPVPDQNESSVSTEEGQTDTPSGSDTAGFQENVDTEMKLDEHPGEGETSINTNEAGPKPDRETYERTLAVLKDQLATNEEERVHLTTSIAAIEEQLAA